MKKLSVISAMTLVSVCDRVREWWRKRRKEWLIASFVAEAPNEVRQRKILSQLVKLGVSNEDLCILSVGAQTKSMANELLQMVSVDSVYSDYLVGKLSQKASPCDLRIIKDFTYPEDVDPMSLN